MGRHLAFNRRTKQTNSRKVKEGIPACPDVSRLAFPFPTSLCIPSRQGHTFFLISFSQGPFLSLSKETHSSVSGHWATSKSTCNSLSKGLNGRDRSERDWHQSQVGGQDVWTLVKTRRDQCKRPGVLSGGGHKRQEKLLTHLQKDRKLAGAA